MLRHMQWQSIPPRASKADDSLATADQWSDAQRSSWGVGQDNAGYQNSELIFACVREIGTSVSEVPLVHVDEDGNDVDDSPLTRLFRQPVPGFPASMWLYALATMPNVFDAAYIRKRRDPFGVEQLTFLNPIGVRRRRNGAYDYTPAAGRPEVIPADDVIELFWPSPLAPVSGLAPMRIAATAAGVDINMIKFMRRHFESPIPPVLLSLNPALDATEADVNQARARWYKAMSGEENWLKVAVMTSSATVQPLPNGWEHMPTLDVRRSTEVRVCQAFGVPPALVGSIIGLERNTYSAPSEMRRQLWTQTLMPFTNLIAEVLTLRVLEEEYPEYAGHELQFDTSQVLALRELEDARAESLTNRAIALFDSRLAGFSEARQIASGKLAVLDPDVVPDDLKDEPAPVVTTPPDAVRDTGDDATQNAPDGDEGGDGDDNTDGATKAPPGAVATLSDEVALAAKAGPGWSAWGDEYMAMWDGPGEQADAGGHYVGMHGGECGGECGGEHSPHVAVKAFGSDEYELAVKQFQPRFDADVERLAQDMAAELRQRNRVLAQSTRKLLNTNLAGREVDVFVRELMSEAPGLTPIFQHYTALSTNVGTGFAADEMVGITLGGDTPDHLPDTVIDNLAAAGAGRLAARPVFDALQLTLRDIVRPADVRGDIGALIVGIENTTQQRIAKTIRDGLRQGDARATIVDQLEQNLGGEGSRRRAETIARTEIRRQANAAAMASYEAAGFQYVRVVEPGAAGAVADTDQPCIDAHRQVWKLDYATAHNLQHPNCQRSFEPWFVETDEDGAPIPPAEDGEVPVREQPTRRRRRRRPPPLEPDGPASRGFDVASSSPEWLSYDDAVRINRTDPNFVADRDQLAGVAEYGLSGYASLNENMRNKRTLTNDDKRQLRDIVEASQPIGRRQVLFRGEGFRGSSANYIAGDTVTFDAPTSASLSPDLASSSFFAGGQNDRGVERVIELTVGPNVPVTFGKEAEAEKIILPGQKMKIAVIHRDVDLPIGPNETRRVGEYIVATVE